MYSANKRQRKFKVFFSFLLVAIPFLFALAILIWFVFLRPSETSASFTKNGQQIAQVQEARQEFSNELFKISLPVGWVDKGKQNPTADKVFYEYDSGVKNNDNRWLHVYVDVFPRNFPINKLLPIDVSSDGKINPGIISDDCTTFTGSPANGSSTPAASDVWSAKWQGVAFTCAMKKADNYVGTASEQEGYAVTIPSSNGKKHSYFFVYIDHNVRPNYTLFIDALKSFQTL
jgi:hypothetical protein